MRTPVRPDDISKIKAVIFEELHEVCPQSHGGNYHIPGVGWTKKGVHKILYEVVDDEA
jgi:hypothetical protein